LGITEASGEAAMLARLERLGLLMVDGGGCIFDEVQVHEFTEAVKKAATNRANGARGGRPQKGGAASSPVAGEDF
jgi:hypothetical protein